MIALGITRQLYIDFIIYMSLRYDFIKQINKNYIIILKIENISFNSYLMTTNNLEINRNKKL